MELAPGASADIEIAYAPVMVGTNTGRLEIVSDAEGNVLSIVQLTGRGIDRDLSLSPTELEFPATYRNTASPATLDLDVANLGEAPLTLSIVEGGAGADAFALAGGLPATLAGGASATIAIEFRPPAAGTFEAYLEVSDDTDEGVARIGLTGIGRVPGIATPPHAVDFGRVVVGIPVQLSDTGAGVIQIVNQETDTFTVRELRLVDAGGSPVDPAEWKILGFTPGSELAGGATLTADIELVAARVGTHEVTLEIYLDDDPLRVAFVTIRAEAVHPAEAGCGCRSAGGVPGGAAPLLLLALMLLVTTRRRRCG